MKKRSKILIGYDGSECADAALDDHFPMMTPVEAAIAEDGSAAEVIVYRIRIDRITGVSEK